MKEQLLMDVNMKHYSVFWNCYYVYYLARKEHLQSYHHTVCNTAKYMRSIIKGEHKILGHNLLAKHIIYKHSEKESIHTHISF